MNFPVLMAGILLAAFIFGATLYALVQAIRTKRSQRLANIVLIFGTLGGMSSIQYLNPTLAVFAGGLLAISAVVATWHEAGVSKLLPIILGLFGVILMLGLPFNI